MSKLDLMIVKKKIDVTDSKNKKLIKVFQPGDVILLNDQLRMRYEQKLSDANLESLVNFIPIDEFIKPFDIREGKRCTTMVIRSGGIGDLLALSTVCEQLPGRVNFLTQAKYFSVFDWYRNRVNAFDYTQPIFTKYSYSKMLYLKQNYRYVKLDDFIENGGSENWYHIFYKSIGMELKPELCRPILRQYNNTENIYNGAKSLLLVHRSTANMRSMSLETMHKAVVNVFPDYEIFVHEYILTPGDIQYAAQNEIAIISSANTSEYLDDVFYASMVVSVDSAAIHFREGVQLPAIGIYNAFSADCRTKYYRYTKSFDIEKVCPKQPCFMHQTAINQVCEYAQLGSTEAPCFSTMNKDIVLELSDKIQLALNKLKAAANPITFHQLVN